MQARYKKHILPAIVVLSLPLAMHLYQGHPYTRCAQYIASHPWISSALNFLLALSLSLAATAVALAVLYIAMPPYLYTCIMLYMDKARKRRD